MSNAVMEYETETNIPFHKNIRFHPELTFGEKMFLAEIQSLSKNAKCPYSSRKMSQLFGVSHQTIINWIKKLTDMDLIEVVVNYRDPNCRQFIKLKDK